MPLVKPRIGALAAVYIGNGPPDTAVLTRFSVPRTKGVSDFEAFAPGTWEPSLEDEIVSDSWLLQFTITFSGAQPAVTKLAMRNSLSVSDEDTAFGSQKFTMLLVGAEENNDHVVIPVCWPQRRFRYNWNDDRISEVPITFIARNRNPHVQPFRKGTLAAMATVLGSRSPV